MTGPARREEIARTRELLRFADAAPGRHYFELLGVTPLEVESLGGGARLRTALRALAAEYHPDRWAGSPHVATATAVMAAVNVAHDTLADTRTRTLYSAGLASTHYACRACAGNGAVWAPRRGRGFAGANEQELRLCSACDGAGWLIKDEPVALAGRKAKPKPKTRVPVFPTGAKK
jgi:DnaJ-class molecular chaperone